MLTAKVNVSVVDEARSPRGPIPVIDGSDAHWDAVESAISRLWIVADVDGPVGRAAAQVMDAFYVVDRERATSGPGAVAASVIDASQMLPASADAFVWLRLYQQQLAAAAADQKRQAMQQIASRHTVTHLGTPDFRATVGRSTDA